MDNVESRLVYSTSFGRACPECARPLRECVCRAQKKAASGPAGGKVQIRFETAGRKGKGVTLISGMPLNENELCALARTLKAQLGTGGAVKDHVIELQGDRREKARQALRALGYEGI